MTSIRVWWLVLALAVMVPRQLTAQTLIIVNLASDEPDADPTDAVCDITFAPNANPPEYRRSGCTLRAAIQTANGIPGSKIIQLQLLQPIVPLSPLPAIDSTVTIRPTPSTVLKRRVIDGRIVGGRADGLVLNGKGSYVYGLSIINWGGAGLVIASDNTGVQASYLGLDPNGKEAGDSIGVYVRNATKAYVGGTGVGQGNVISANFTQGVVISASTDVVVLHNYIGTDTTGKKAKPNALIGVLVEQSQRTRIGDVSVGPPTGNVISGNGQGGITISRSIGSFVLQNFIGVDVTGQGRLGNGGDGVFAKDSPNTSVGPGAGSTITSTSLPPASACGAIPSTASSVGNVVSNNTGNGISIQGAASTGAFVEQNRIGTDSSGKLPFGNGQSGVFIVDAPGATIGGLSYDTGNLIASNLIGLTVQGIKATDVQIHGNWIGVDATGVRKLGNTEGGIFIDRAPNAHIGSGTSLWHCNLVSGNSAAGHFSGIRVAGDSAAGATIAGNYVGLDKTGAKALGNGGNGITIYNAPNATVGGQNRPGGPYPRNLVAGNGESGIEVEGDSASHARILGNYVGTDSGGRVRMIDSSTSTIARQAAGVYINNAPDALIGDTLPNAGNVISGGNQQGIVISGPRAVRTHVHNNYVGVASDGRISLGNRNAGIEVHEAPRNVIGGKTKGAKKGPPVGNVISGNWAIDSVAAIVIEGDTATDNLVQGNLIGTDTSGTRNVGNFADGVDIHHLASRNTIGGLDSLEANVIAFNGHNGVTIGRKDTATGRYPVSNAILSNSIYSNKNIGIDLNDDSVTVTAPRKQAGRMQSRGAGPNGWAAAPYLYAQPDSGVGTLDSDANAFFTVQFFSSPKGDPTGFGQGKKLLGTRTVQTNKYGFVSFDLPRVTTGEVLSATATDSSNNTSEFARLACDDGVQRDPSLSFSTREWRQTGNQYQATALGRPVLPVYYDSQLGFAIKLDKANPDSDDALRWAFVTVAARNVFPGPQSTTAVVFREAQPLDSTGSATVPVNALDVLKALAIAPNTNLVEAEVRVCYRGRTQTAVSTNLLHIVREKLVVFLPGVLGSQIYVNGGRAFPPRLPFKPSNSSIADLAFDKTTLRPKYDADSVTLFDNYLGLVTVYDTAKFTLARNAVSSADLPTVSVTAGAPFSYFYFRAWPYDWRLRLEESVSALAQRPSGLASGSTAPPLQELLDTARAAHPYLHDHVALAGHSTGGLIIRSALTPTPPALPPGKTFQQWVDHAYFINTPLLGAPKAYYALLTGRMVPGLLDTAIMQTIAPDMPIVYYLSPAPGYVDPTATPINAAMTYRVGSVTKVGRRNTTLPAGSFMKPAIATAGVGRWNDTLAAWADGFYQNIGRTPPVIRWANALVFHGELQTPDTPGPVRVRGPLAVDYGKTAGDGTVPTSSLLGYVPLTSQSAFALSLTAPQQIHGTLPQDTITFAQDNIAHDQAANSQIVWERIMRHLLLPDLKDFRGYGARDSIVAAAMPPGMSSATYGEMESDRYADSLGYGSIMRATAPRSYAQGYDALYCDGEVVPKAMKTANGVWFSCDGTIVIGEAKGDGSTKSLENLLKTGYKYRQGTIEWAHRAADTLLAASAPNASQRRAAEVMLDALHNGAPIRIEVFQADYVKRRDRWYRVAAIYWP